MATAQDIIDKARGRLQDYDDKSITDTILLKFINSGVTEFASTTNTLQAKDTISGITGASTALSGLAQKYVLVYNVEHSNLVLSLAHREDGIKWNPSAGTPTAYYIFGDTCYIDFSITSSSLEFTYSYVPADMTAVGNTCAILDKWIPAIIAYTVYRVHDSNRESGLADRARAEYETLRTAAALTMIANQYGDNYAG